MARAARRTLKLDRVLLVPARLSPLKAVKPTAARHRLAMLRLAVGKIPWLEVASLELKRPAPSYTVNTLKSLKRRFPKGTEFFLLMGADSYKYFHKWRDYKEISKLSTVSVFSRPGIRIRGRMLRISMPSMSVSATMLRVSLASGRRIPAGGIPTVLAYARRYHLYSN